ncbi:MAG: DUF2157 domain-containing protein [bacterium]
MKLNKKSGKLVQTVIQKWKEDALLSPEDADRLFKSIAIVPFDWKRLAKYSFWIAIICVIQAVGAVFLDIAEIIKKLWNTPFAGCAVFALLAGGLFFLGLRRRTANPVRIYSNEAIFFLGILAVAVSIAFLGKAIDTGSGHFSLLLLLAAVVYGILGLWFPLKLVWIFAILSLGSWFGAETGYVSGWGAYWLGMNYPVRFVLFGSVMIGLSYGFHVVKSSKESYGLVKNLDSFSQSTYVMGLLYLFIALWILSLFGNYGDMSAWRSVKQYELFHWSVLFALAAGAAIFHGLRTDDNISRGFGLTFLFINLYTRFFEYFWDVTHKAVFFTILAASFWAIGTKAEKIWSIGQRKETPAQGD